MFLICFKVEFSPVFAKYLTTLFSGNKTATTSPLHEGRRQEQHPAVKNCATSTSRIKNHPIREKLDNNHKKNLVTCAALSEVFQRRKEMRPPIKRSRYIK